MGAKLGANVVRHPAAPGHIQPQSLLVKGMRSDTEPRLATGWACMACKRSGVRIPKLHVGLSTELPVSYRQNCFGDRF